MAKRRCRGKTKAGKACKNTPLKGSDYCIAHQPRKEKERRGFGGPQPGSGRPKKPRFVEVLLDQVEGEIERWLKPFTDALEAERPVVVGTGEDAYLDYVPDHRTRIEAAKAVLDRVYGRPKQATELTGEDGGPLQMEVTGAAIVGDKQARDAARKLRRRAAASKVQPKRAGDSD